MFGESELNPATEDGVDFAMLDELIETVHGEEKKLILVSAYLPYDIARYQDADAIVTTFGSAIMRELPAPG